MEVWIPLACSGALALVLSACITPLVASVARHRGWFDHPNARKVHQDPVPRLGGVGIFAGFFVSALVGILVAARLFPSAWADAFSLRALTVAAAVVLICAVGLVDDFSNLPALFKLGLQVAAAALATAGGFIVPLAGPDGSLVLRIVAWIITMGWIVGITNAVNLVDGMDGLAGGIAGIASISLGAVALLHGSPSNALVAAALLGAVGGFLIFNFPPARIFMGDSGSYLLGFSLSIIPLLGSAGTRAAGPLLAPLVALSIPILDTFAAIIRRARRHQPVHSPDKEHIHHVLLALGLEGRTILAVLYGYGALLGAAAVVVSLVRWEIAVAITVAAWVVNVALYAVLRAAGRRMVASARRSAVRRKVRAREKAREVAARSSRPPRA
jgi:UDP-GlcNAc:undecaprenyl-phosphate/decaprenyl-phosphate GlcNAc-1-phosphate transferase